MQAPVEPNTEPNSKTYVRGPDRRFPTNSASHSFVNSSIFQYLSIYVLVEPRLIMAGTAIPVHFVPGLCGPDGRGSSHPGLASTDWSWEFRSHSMNGSSEKIICTPQYSNMAIENGPFISDLPNKASIHRGFSIAMFEYQRIWYGRNPNHQLIGGKHHIICRVSTILLVVQDFFHPQWVWDGMMKKVWCGMTLCYRTVRYCMGGYRMVV